MDDWLTAIYFNDIQFTHTTNAIDQSFNILGTTDLQDPK